MPRTIEISVFKFSELKGKAKEKARNWFREGGLDYEWWDSVYEDAKNVGLKITEFDLGRGQHIKGKFTQNAINVAEAIVKDHGHETETYKSAKSFLKEWKTKRKKDFEESEEAEDLGSEFLKTILNDYARILQNEYDYLTSDEAVDENIEANEYEFNEDGSRARV